MNVKEYISSGILELYVLGQLSPEEEREVEIMISQYTEVQREIYEISIGLEKYGQLSAIKAPDAITNKLFNNLPAKNTSVGTQNSNSKSSDKTSGTGYNFLTVLFAVTSVLGIIMYFMQGAEHKSEIEQYKKSVALCDSIQQVSQTQFALLKQINDPNNKIIDLTPTPGFQGIAVYLHHNAADRKNFLQLISLPEITSAQAFQLWSLKPGQDPIPLTVFADRNKIIEVAFEDNTATYAITIEPAGGSKTPSLDKLIGTMGVI
ncbi:MAG: anti-sigma factor [Saprospiraceae bacterium]|nr:anti-sigma factor [Saprospiraceae bacterium]